MTARPEWPSLQRRGFARKLAVDADEVAGTIIAEYGPPHDERHDRSQWTRQFYRLAQATAGGYADTVLAAGLDLDGEPGDADVDGACAEPSDLVRSFAANLATDAEGVMRAAVKCGVDPDRVLIALRRQYGWPVVREPARELWRDRYLEACQAERDTTAVGNVVDIRQKGAA
jgi:hypothetical protein